MVSCRTRKIQHFLAPPGEAPLAEANRMTSEPNKKGRARLSMPHPFTVPRGRCRQQNGKAMLMKLRLLGAISAFAFLLGPTFGSEGDNWPGFRGPTGLGYTEDPNIPLTWGGPDGKGILWQAPLNGQGH